MLSESNVQQVHVMDTPKLGGPGGSTLDFSFFLFLSFFFFNF